MYSTRFSRVSARYYDIPLEPSAQVKYSVAQVGTRVARAERQRDSLCAMRKRTTCPQCRWYYDSCDTACVETNTRDVGVLLHFEPARNVDVNV